MNNNNTKNQTKYNLNQITIREMTMADYPAVRAMWNAEPGITISSVDEPEAIKRLLEHSPGLSLVAEYHGEIIGSVLGSQDTRRGYVHHLVVVPHARGIGLGRRLMEEILSRFAAIGIPKVHLFVMKTNPQVESFYRHLGWIERRDLTMFSFNLPPKPNATKQQTEPQKS